MARVVTPGGSPVDPERYLEELVDAVMRKSGVPKRLRSDLFEEIRRSEAYRDVRSFLRGG